MRFDRAVVVWSVLSVLLAALGGGQASADVDGVPAFVLGALFAAVTAVGCGTSRVLLALRRGRIVVDAAAPPYLVWRGLAPVVVVAVVAGGAAAAATAHVVARPFALLVMGAWAGVAAALGVHVPARVAAARVSRAAWLLSGAAVAGVVAGIVGAVVVVARFGAAGRVAPGELARLLAGTSLSYALLGLGGFQKAFSEHRAGVVVVDGAPLRGTPGPFLVGLALAAACALVGPHVLPPLAVDDVLVVKCFYGVVVGFGLSLLGAVAGHRVAVEGRGRGAPSAPRA